LDFGEKKVKIELRISDAESSFAQFCDKETKRNGTLTMLHPLHTFCDDLETQSKHTAVTLAMYSSIYFRRRSRR